MYMKIFKILYNFYFFKKLYIKLNIFYKNQLSALR